ncbi:MAG: hypothetical protein ISQ34_03800 [Rickettsiales bacterium]|nr:hypothetical protein [Rickettsiales bacterium]
MFCRSILISILFAATVQYNSWAQSGNENNEDVVSNVQKVEDNIESNEEVSAKVKDVVGVKKAEKDRRKYTPLMFTNKEYDNLQKAILSFVNNVEYVEDQIEFTKLDKPEEKKEEEKSQRSYIYLASLLYFSEDNWVIWVNDKKITSEDNDPKNEFYVKEITKNSANIVWKLGVTKWKIITGKSDEELPKTDTDNQIINNFTLRPNQTYILVEDNIIEGKVTISNSSIIDKAVNDLEDFIDNDKFDVF